jgi:hypothetical protein
MLARVDEEAESLALELWQIWKRWETAFYAGKATRESHPALPEDRPRMLEAETRLHQIRTKLSWDTCCRMADIKPLEDQNAEAEVFWEKLETPPLNFQQEFRDRVTAADADLLKVYSRPRAGI